MSHLIKNERCLIPDGDPFRNDKLLRKGPVKYLTYLISTLKQPFVLSINSSWGTGKTTFLTMWRAYLKAEGYHSIYLNAWENDYSKTPFVSFVGEIKEYMTNCVLKKNSPKYLREKVKTVTEKGADVAPKVIGKLAGLFSLVQGMEEVGGVAGNAAEAVTANLIDGYLGTKSSVKGFKAELEDLVEALERNKQKLPLVFFIDELDRCRPDYAIELLETAKHLFDVTGIVFVIAVDREQLSHTVKHLYGGEGMDANGYLRRFIDLEYTLDNDNVGQFVEHLFRNVYKLDRFLDERGVEEDDSLGFLNVVIRHCLLFRMRLRDIEKVFVRLNIVTRLYPPTHHFFYVPVSFYTLLREADHQTYLVVKNKEENAEGLGRYIDKINRNVAQDMGLDRCDIKACETLARGGKMHSIIKQVENSISNNRRASQPVAQLEKQAGIYTEYARHGFHETKSIRTVILELIDLTERFA